MYRNPATQNNLSVLEKYGVVVFEAESGELASGLTGQGRMAEPEHIVENLTKFLKQSLPLAGKRVLINAGPTYEKIDAVRFIGNFSTGKMGVALARHAYSLGATVDLILGPVQLPFDLSGISTTRVTSAQEMLVATQKKFSEADITILTAAVADYRPKTIVDHKIKKSEEALTIELEPTEDILAYLGKIKEHNQILVGFALESDRELEYAQEKLARKNLDFVILNSLRDPGAGFGYDTNKVTVIHQSGKQYTSDTRPKEEIAAFIWNKILKDHHA
jgi:phosphopantothenoylcysteine decarboxylase/phosphopantothenate--cysteine ligase